jgi:hypothetical protein
MGRFGREEVSIVGKISGGKRCKPGVHAEKYRMVARREIVHPGKNVAAPEQGSSQKQRCFQIV